MKKKQKNKPGGHKSGSRPRDAKGFIDYVGTFTLTPREAEALLEIIREQCEKKEKN